MVVSTDNVQKPIRFTVHTNQYNGNNADRKQEKQFLLDYREKIFQHTINILPDSTNVRLGIEHKGLSCFVIERLTVYTHVCPETVSDLVVYPLGFINLESMAQCVSGTAQDNSEQSVRVKCTEDGWMVLGKGCQCPSGSVPIASGRTCRRMLQF